jgi:phospholipase/carboxylesterase
LIVSSKDARGDLVFLHGYDMQSSAFSAFAESAKMPVVTHLPQARIPVSDMGFSWWQVDANRRREDLQRGARDLSETTPADRDVAHDTLASCIQAVRNSQPTPRPIILGGFSQGGMLACDAVVLGKLKVDALVLLSSCRVAASEWDVSRMRLTGLPVLITHGREDANIGLAAGKGLADELRRRGAEVEWVEFDGGHETPLPVWRAVRRFVTRCLTSQ